MLPAITPFVGFSILNFHDISCIGNNLPMSKSKFKFKIFIFKLYNKIKKHNKIFIRRKYLIQKPLQ